MNVKDKLRAPQNKPIQRLVKQMDLNTRGIAKNFSAWHYAWDQDAKDYLAGRCAELVIERRALRECDGRQAEGTKEPMKIAVNLLLISIAWFAIYAWTTRKSNPQTPKQLALAFGAVVPWIYGVLHIAFTFIVTRFF